MEKMHKRVGLIVAQLNERSMNIKDDIAPGAEHSPPRSMAGSPRSQQPSTCRLSGAKPHALPQREELVKRGVQPEPLAIMEDLWSFLVENGIKYPYHINESVHGGVGAGYPPSIGLEIFIDPEDGDGPTRWSIAIMTRDYQHHTYFDVAAAAEFIKTQLH